MVPTSAVAGLFLLSGAASLLYQVVWMRMLIRVFGVTTPAVSVVVAAFMGGLALGAWLGAARSRRAGSGLGLYARLELACAFAGIVATALVAFLPQVYAGLAGESAGPAARALARLGLSALVLLPPTALMGATLPVLTRSLAETEKRPGFVLAVLYGFNTLGAVLGVLFSGYVSLAVFGERRTAGLAAVGNLLCGLGGLVLSRRAKAEEVPAAAPRAPAGGLFLWLFALSGFVALGLEVLWSRLMVLLVGSSVYAFSALLAADLLGVGLGSLWAARILKTRSPSREEAAAAYGLLQAGVAAAVLLGVAAYRFEGLRTLDFRYLYSPLSEPGDILAFWRDCALVVFAPALLMGLAFPLAAPLLARGEGDAGAAAGRAFAASTLGGVVGSLAAGFWLVPALGTARSLALLSAVSLAAGAAALSRGAARAKAWTAFCVLAAAALAAGLWSRDPARDILKKRLEASGATMAFHVEQTAATVTGAALDGGVRALLLNGIAVSANGAPGKAMAYVPLLLRPRSRRMLVICFGAGNTFRSALSAGLDVDAVDLVPGVLDAFPWFYPDAPAFLARRGARRFVDDGRHFLLTGTGGYDAIVVDGTPPIFAAQTVNLYTAEFLALARRRLNPGGVLALWVPIPCLLGDFGMIARNFSDAFPHVAFWAYPSFAGMLLMGSDAPLEADPKRLEAARRALGVERDMPELTAARVTGGMPLTEARLRRVAAVFPPLTDDEPRTEFPLGPLLAGGEFLGDAPALVRGLFAVEAALDRLDPRGRPAAQGERR